MPHPCFHLVNILLVLNTIYWPSFSRRETENSSISRLLSVVLSSLLLRNKYLRVLL
uniref:Uncharacterized protein n=1 Tax=Setaria italica TaxID=4555 RepID=K3ZYZ4_SETIT